MSAAPATRGSVDPMHSLASASALLSRITDINSATALLAELGFTTDIVPLDAESCERLGLPHNINSPHIARGKGALSALTFAATSPSALRSAISDCASHLSQTTPHLLWLIIATADTGEIAIASWSQDTAKPRIAALIANRNSIVDSDAETICTLSAATTTSDSLTHQRWLETLGRQSIGRSFFRCLQRSVSDMAQGLGNATSQSDAAELALVYTSRLIFLCFLETKGWLNRDHAFLANTYADCMVTGGRYHERVLAPLFFGTLNTPPRNRAPRARSFGKVPFLNGGLFARSPLERNLRNARFTDESLGNLYANLLTRYRFTAREDSAVWSEAAIDPEMLGKSFESLMASSNRKTTGAFYTPQSLVGELTTSGLTGALSGPHTEIETIARALAGQIPEPEAREEILGRISSFRVLDPSCGSGAFLVHILEQLSTLCTRLGDVRPPHTIRRSILTSSIFGVDINPMAVWLCELRLWLSMAIEDPERDPMKVRPLPNLDRHIRVGDSLSGGGFHDRDTFRDARRLATARAKYARATGPRRKTLARAIDRTERACALESLAATIRALTLTRLDLIATARSRDLFGHRLPPPVSIAASLATIRTAMRQARREMRSIGRGAALPFSFQTHFADAGAAGGFDLVIGNPPWVRTGNFNPTARASFRQDFWVFRHSAWASGAQSAGAASGFASQVDLAALFIERSVRLTRPSGTIALLVPAKLWRSLAGGGVREFLLRHTRLTQIHDLTDSPQVFDAVVYPSLVVATVNPVVPRRLPGISQSRETVTMPAGSADPMGSHTFSIPLDRKSSHRIECPGGSAYVHRRSVVATWSFDPAGLAFDPSPGSPWLLLPPEVRTAFNLLAAAGIPLSESIIGRPLLGVKTGCNEAFVVELVDESCIDGVSIVKSAGRSGEIESTLLRPLARGDSVVPWKTVPAGSRIVWTHGDDGLALRQLPSHARKWLGSWRRRLEDRSDASGRERWWMLFRTESASAEAPRVFWSDIGKIPRAVAIPAGDPVVALNTCYVARCRDMTDAHTLATLLNSPVTAAWLNAIAEPARGGYNRYLGWTVALLPAPKDWSRARGILAPIGAAAAGGQPPPLHELVSATLDAYGVSHAEVEALMTWSVR
ncbi:MAG: DNA methyltransferase [Gemmatimonadaceae bacterium]